MDPLVAELPSRTDTSKTEEAEKSPLQNLVRNIYMLHIKFICDCCFCQGTFGTYESKPETPFIQQGK